MSAGVCGKRVGHEEIFGSSSSSQCSSAKKSRRSSYGSPNPSEPGFDYDNSVSVLLQMFPALDPEVVERAFRNHNCEIEDAVKYLGVLSSGIGRDILQNTDSAVIGNCNAVFDQHQSTCSQMQEETIEGKNSVNSIPTCGLSQDGMKWVELFVNEMMNARDLDDARGCAARLLEAFERCISAQARVSEELKHASLKEHLQNLLNDNQILKRAVAIQHERNVEQEEKIKGVQHLKNVLNQCHEKVRSLELNNYALKVHLQRAQESKSVFGKFPPPDIF